MRRWTVAGGTAAIALILKSRMKKTWLYSSHISIYDTVYAATGKTGKVEIGPDRLTCSASY